MDHSKLVKSYFESFRDKDIVSLKAVLGEGFGIRTFNGKLLFNFEDLENLFNNFTLESITIIDMETTKDTVYVNTIIEYKIDSKSYSKSLVSKFVFRDGLIVRVFETVKNDGYTRIKCIVTYDGSSFSGFQRQPNEMTVQGEIEKALDILKVIHNTNSNFEVERETYLVVGIDGIQKNYKSNTLIIRKKLHIYIHPMEFT